MQDLRHPINRATRNTPASGAPANPEILSDLATVQRGHEMEVVNPYNIRRVWMCMQRAGPRHGRP